MTASSLGELVESMLYEGYALYPYTPQATKNATPTPFGIVYPPAYAAGTPGAFDHLQMDCVLDPGDEAEVRAEVAFLQATGVRHQATERRVRLDPVGVRGASAPLREASFEFEGLAGVARLTAKPWVESSWRVCLRVENTTIVPPGTAATMTRAEALSSALISAHPVLTVENGRWRSPLEVSGCENVNTWPVLATDEDDAMLGAAIILPDHPEIAPESRGNLFDNTEIEEALLLHVHALSDAERDAAAQQDPAVKEMIERALAAAPEDIAPLHGAFKPSPPEGQSRRPAGLPEPPPWLEDVPGEEQVEVQGRKLRRGEKVVLRLGDRIDVHDQMMNGRIATIERIFVDYDDRIHLGVTIDSDPMQEVLRESGRFLFFFPNEVEVVPG